MKMTNYFFVKKYSTLNIPVFYDGTFKDDFNLLKNDIEVKVILEPLSVKQIGKYMNISEDSLKIIYPNVKFITTKLETPYIRFTAN